MKVFYTYLMIFATAVAKPPIAVHLGLGDDPVTERIIQWVSDDLENVTVTKQINHMNFPNFKIEYEKVPMSPGTIGNWIQRATVKELVPGATYSYRVGTSGAPLQFRAWTNVTKPGEYARNTKFLFCGSIEEDLEHQAFFGEFDAVVNLGTLSCNQSLVAYLHELEVVAGSAVYLTTPGSEEHKKDFSLYSQLFSMPNVSWPMKRFWYSFNTRLVHFVSFTTEVYFPVDNVKIQKQLAWLREDLKRANDQRTGLPGSRPWIIAYSHRAIYCSGHLGCINYSIRLAQLEELFHEFGVDLIITAQHDVYERTYPVYKGKVVSKDFYNPRAAVHVTSAAFTCPNERAQYSDINENSPDWSAFKKKMLYKSTYGKLIVHNRTHLEWFEGFVNKEKGDRTAFDQFFLVQTRHGSFKQSSGVKATTVILGIVIVILVVIISGFLYLRFKAFMRRKAAERKMSYVNLTSSLEL